MSDNDKTSTFVFNKHSDKNPNGQQVRHRCNGYLEDVLEGVSQWPMDVSKPFSLFLSCLRSQPGQEPPRYKSQKDN